MPHDVKGKLIRVGDKVNVPCIVEQITQAHGEEYCNVTLRTVHPMPPTADGTQIALNARQTKKTDAKG
jgi:hypothetical protein